MLWSITSGVLTLTDGQELTRSYHRNHIDELYDTWITDLSSQGHIGYSHSTFNADGTYQLDMAFYYAGGSCYLDVMTTGTYIADSATLTITHQSGTQSLSQCDDDSYNHTERPLTTDELAAYNAQGQMYWSITSGQLTLTDGMDLTRSYQRNHTEELYATWVTDMNALGHTGFSHSTFNSDGTYKLDMEFYYLGGDCFLDVTTHGTYTADSATLTITHQSGTQTVSGCLDDANNHEQRTLTEGEIAAYNAQGRLNWSITSGMLSLSDGGELTRIYSKLP